jgi:lysozyme family protein
VLSRGSDPALGHVAFLVGRMDDAVALLGGNQADSVSVALFPKSRLIGLRWPTAGATSDRATEFAAEFDAALAHVLNMEGGYTDDPADPGGPTNFGITLADYAQSRGATLNAASRESLIVGLRHISADDVRAIYIARYWLPAHCADLPSPIALFHFDCAVNMGVGTASRMLQTALGVMIDGVIGPDTLAAARAADPVNLLATYADLRRSRYRSLAMFPRFGRGWLARVDTTLKRATSLISATSPAKGPPPMLDPAPSNPPAPKWWGHSLTVWGAVVTGLSAVLPALAPAFGFDVSPDTVHTAADQVSAILQATFGLAGTVATIFGRVRATQSLTQRSVMLKL